MLISFAVVVRRIAPLPMPKGQRPWDDGDAPAVQGRRILHPLLLTLSSVFTDLVADDATDRGAADRSECAAARENSTSDSTYAGADCGVPVLRRHPAATTQAEQHCHGHRTDCKSVHRFHLNTSLSNIRLNIYICLPMSFTYQQSIGTRKSPAVSRAGAEALRCEPIQGTDLSAYRQFYVFFLVKKIPITRYFLIPEIR
jgi:hypothetical protein